MSSVRITAAMCARGRVLAEPRLSSDGSSLAFAVTADGRGSIVVVPTDGGPELVITAAPPSSPTAAYGGGVFDWLASGDSLVYVGADGLLYFQPVAGGPARTVVTDGPVAAPAVSPDGTKVAYIKDGRDVGVASLGETAPWPIRLSTGADFALDPAWSPDGLSIAWHEWDVPAMPWDDSRIVTASADGTGKPEPVAISGAAAVGQPRYAPDGSALGFLCDADGWLNLWSANPSGADPRPLLTEPAEHGGPSWGPGERSYAWSPDGRQVVFCRNERGFGRLCLLDVASGQVRELDRGIYHGLSWIAGRIAGIRSGAKTPGQVVVLEPGSEPGATAGATTRKTVARGPVAGFESSGLIEPEAVDWEGDDLPGVGRTVHGRLYRTTQAIEELPAGEAPPLLVWIHGGPTGQNQVVFNARVAYFCDRGFNVLQVDHRGSSGWGRAYTQALRGEWGRLDVADTAAGMRAAAANGWGSPNRIAPIGGSAGGFTVLLLLALHTDVCGAGVALYGVTDLFELDETTHRFEAHYLHSIVGPLPEAAERYRERSPVVLADRITAPLLVLQGSADKVVPKAQSDALVARLQQRGTTVEYHVYDGEGHGWSRPEVVEDELERTWTFLRRHLLRRRP
ncbi:MAG TPA: S9 family peptidase [Acidimicrobiales bacterium]|nr:S9 family peptidase [Acidimicrobiales bacterium]